MEAENTQKQLSGQVSQEQLDNWKKQYGNVWEVVVEDKICYLKKASRATLRVALSFLERDKIKYMEVVIENCWLGGDAEIKTNDDYFYGLTTVVPELTASKQAEIKKY